MITPNWSFAVKLRFTVFVLATAVLSDCYSHYANLSKIFMAVFSAITAASISFCDVMAVFVNTVSAAVIAACNEALSPSTSLSELI